MIASPQKKFLFNLNADPKCRGRSPHRQHAFLTIDFVPP